MIRKKILAAVLTMTLLAGTAAASAFAAGGTPLPLSSAQQEDGSVLVDTGDVHTVVMPGVDRYQITTSHTGMVGMSAPFSFGMAPYISQENIYVPLGLIDALLNGQGDSVTVSGNSIAIQDAG